MILGLASFKKLLGFAALIIPGKYLLIRIFFSQCYLMDFFYYNHEFFCTDDEKTLKKKTSKIFKILLLRFMLRKSKKQKTKLKHTYFKFT